jgi:hypothetical protein
MHAPMDAFTSSTIAFDPIKWSGQLTGHAAEWAGGRFIHRLVKLDPDTTPVSFLNFHSVPPADDAPPVATSYGALSIRSLCPCPHQLPDWKHA